MNTDATVAVELTMDELVVLHDQIADELGHEWGDDDGALYEGLFAKLNAAQDTLRPLVYGPRP